MRISQVKDKKVFRLPGHLAFWRRAAIQRRWHRLCDWTTRALEKLAEGG